RPVPRGDGRPVEPAGVGEAGVDAVLAQTGDAEAGQPLGGAGGAAGGVDDQVGGEFGRHAVGGADQHAGDLAGVTEQPDGPGAGADPDPRVLADPAPHHTVGQVTARGDQ